MKGIIGKKLGMTSIFNEDGKSIPCTLIEAGPCVVTQVKTEETDGYYAHQLAFGERKEKRTTKAMKGHFAAAKSSPMQKAFEVRDFDTEAVLGDTILCDIFEQGEVVKVTGQSKGKGFQGVVKRHGFAGVGMATHGQHNRMRAPGSIGMASTPSRVFKGMRMGGQTGNVKRTTTGLRIEKVVPEKNLIVVRGSVPGAKGSYLMIAN